MLKRMTVKKISIATILLFICFLFVLFPKEDKVINLDGKEIIEYSSNSLEHEIFMVNKDNPNHIFDELKYWDKDL